MSLCAVGQDFNIKAGSMDGWPWGEKVEFHFKPTQGIYFLKNKNVSLYHSRMGDMNSRIEEIPFLNLSRLLFFHAMTASWHLVK